VPQPPSGTVTFLFTDIEGSTRRWEGDILDGWFKPMSNIILERDRLPAAALVDVEAALGTDSYRNARARGALMSYDELVELVLTELDAALTAFD
jgi:hypothetical protein